MKCRKCGHGMVVTGIEPLDDGGEMISFKCGRCTNEQWIDTHTPDRTGGFDGLGLCPNCLDVETPGGKLCAGCRREFQEYNH